MTVIAANLPPEFPWLVVAVATWLAACIMLACIDALPK